MKSMLKILTRYVASAVGVTLILLVLNLAVLLVWGFQASRTAINEYHFSEIADSLTRQNGVYTLSEAGKKAIDLRYPWALLLDDSGSVIWSLNRPADVPLHYSIADVASFTHWYLNDYPVYVWRHPDGLLVLGRPKGSLWKKGIEAPEEMMQNAPAWIIGALIINAIAAILLALLFGMRLFRSLRPLARGIEDMAARRPIALSTGGILGDLATKLNQTSTQFQRQEVALQERDNARTSWVAAVSHDIRTPLSMVMGYASQLEDNPHLSSDEREQARIIRRQSEKIKTLVNDLNLASKLEYEMQPLRTDSIVPAALVRGVVADFLNNGLESGYIIDLNVENNTQNMVLLGDEELLRRAVSNLIGNSIEHNPEGCAISVAVQKDSTHCLITVSDNGIGFPQEVLETLQNPENPAVLGSRGLGLTIVRQIMKAHGGTAEFNNLPGDICQVVLRLPIMLSE